MTDQDASARDAFPKGMTSEGRPKPELLTNTPPTSENSSEDLKSTNSGGRKSFFSYLNYTPPWCRHNPDQPFEFSIWQNLLFAFAGAFTVANLYYSIPILNVLARDFDVHYITISRIPTLMQGGYATGMLFICPLGDLFPRRPFTLLLVFITATLWIALCVTNNFNVFLAVSYISSVTTVTPQIMLPLVSELAPPNKRALALSVVVSGNMLGIIIARILSGVVTNYTSWRNIYWIALALQYIIFSLLWLFMPAYPATNPTPTSFKKFCKEYPRLLFSILQLCVKHPVLLQSGFISLCTSAFNTAFWTTLTFLLSGTPYFLSPTNVGLFGLIGVAGMIMGPFYAKYIIQPLRVPLYSVILGEVINISGAIVGAYTGNITLAGPIIQALTLDAGLQITQVANRTMIYRVAGGARNRVNTSFMILSFLGQITGTSAGNKLYERAGWRGSGSLGVGILALSFLFASARGPHVDEGQWVGWKGGWGRDRRDEDGVRIKGEGAFGENAPTNEDKTADHKADNEEIEETKQEMEERGEDIRKK